MTSLLVLLIYNRVCCQQTYVSDVASNKACTSSEMNFVVNAGSNNGENCGSGCSADARTHDREYEETWRRLPIKVPMESLAELLAGKIASGQRNFGGSIFAAWRWLFGLVIFLST